MRVSTFPIIIAQGQISINPLRHTKKEFNYVRIDEKNIKTRWSTCRIYIYKKPYSIVEYGLLSLLDQYSGMPVAITFLYQRKESLGIRRPVG